MKQPVLNINGQSDASYSNQIILKLGRLLELLRVSLDLPVALILKQFEDQFELVKALGIDEKEFNVQRLDFKGLCLKFPQGMEYGKLEGTNGFECGDYFMEYCSISPIQNENQYLKYWVVLLGDSDQQYSESQRKSMELILEEIKESLALTEDESDAEEHRFRKFFENSLGLMCIHDLSGKLLMVNESSANSLGYKKEELIGRELQSLMPLNHQKGFEGYLISIKEKGFAQGIMKILNKSGEPKIWLFSNVLEKGKDGSEYVLGNALDITERNKLELEYNRLKEILQQTNEMARVGGWECDFEKNKIHWSKVTREIHEVDEDFQPDIDDAIDFYKEGESRNKIIKAVELAASEGKPYDLELQLITAKGKEKWVRAIGHPEFKNGICVRLFGTFQDINEKKHSEIEIIRSKKLLEDVQNASSEVSIISTDKYGMIIVFNRGAEKMLGYSADEMVNKQSPAIIHDPNEVAKRGEELSEEYGEKIEGFRVFVYKSQLEGAEEREWTYIRKDGSRFYVSLAVTTIRDEKGDIEGYLGIATDITERKDAERQLIIEKARLNAFVTHAPAAVAMFDTEIKYVAYSNRWLEEYKLQGQDLKNRSHYEVFPGISDEWKSIHSRCLKGEVISNEEDVWRPPGWDHDQYLRWEVRPWYQFDGEIGGIMMLTQDITEACLQREELKRAKVLAEQASIAKSEFLANMSHEIRTPLNGVIGFTDLVLKTELTETQAQYLSIVNQSGNSLLNIINDILDFSKIEAGKLDLDVDKNDLYELTNQASDIITYEVHRKGLEMLLNIDPDIPRYIWVDSVRLKQVLVNLLGNASKFTEKGEIELKLSPLGKANKNGEMAIRFSVKDTGIGIHPDKQNKIFKAFSQEDVSTTKKYGGTGLGLTISNSLLHMMGSKMNLVSELGKGSTFYFDLKVKCEHGEPMVWDEELDIKSILIVDDNENNRMILERMLELRGISTVQAKNGFEAIQRLINGEKFDVILMDYHMPMMDGIETIRKIRESFDQEPIIFLHSSSDDEKIVKACRELNVQLRLVKPIKLRDMYNSLLTINRKGINKKNQDQKVEETSVLPSNTKVLLVEDNSINMLLAKTVLENLSPGIKILEAFNGKEALEICSKELPDIILMDVQMPEMNGYEATAAIREKYHKNNILIIALTAGNIKGEKEKCLKAGMNDFIAKPFVEEDLVKLLEKWTVKPEEYTSSFKPSKAESMSDFDVEQLKRLLGINEVENEMFQTILKSGVKELESSLQDIAQLSKDKNPQLTIAAHKLYGSSRSLRMEKLAELSGGIEKSGCKDFEDLNLIVLVEKVLEELKVSIAAVKQYIKN
ncbi:PAS domain-containing hybrid sensor histidine kinase/response regulator [Echinicola shivajiensis]|uniref:PAS domain-containing hybrid sensor histidine kinase/response regulator n=1 Tax=Echinicola shivajiensis TaxID=1035916 RepID=UPI001BFCD262|nr:PAS domain S-box protein [Echinicola shivajiensis]